MSAESEPGPEDVVRFWREAGREKWFEKDTAFDRAMEERFAALHAAAAAGEKRDWARTPEGALALILVLDQFSRNMFRGSPRAFAQDRMASALAREAIAAGFDRKVPAELSPFFYLPFMHAETIAEQEESVRLFHALGGDQFTYARIHEEAIRRFGRFPHRNPVLGRHMSPAEQAYLDAGGFSG